MRHLDWQMILFVGASLAHDYWIYWGFPRVYYWDVKHKNLKEMNEGNGDDKKAA
ncbi:hypothetical protein LG329_01245 [Virgibacillus necropolis]|uniref:hypothetical protein n=1 Tax=Virgibacillus necropolis TaxID=163877 RepID=UPI00384C74E7